MPFPFVHVCDLLDELERLHIRNNPLLPRDLHERTTSRANQWLKNHKFDLNAFDTQEAAVLWILRPDKLTDRHYGIDVHRLESIVARVYQLSSQDYAKLQSWQTMPHLGDLGACVDLVRGAMKVSNPRKQDIVNVEEIQSTLIRIASSDPHSSPAVRSLANHMPGVDIIQSLGSIYERLHGREAKWLTRYILKDYRAIMLPDSWEMESGRIGMPNVASITLNMFTKPAPIPIMIEGTRVVKGVAPVADNEHCVPLTAQVGKNGWPRRSALKSREPSPISQPLTFAKGVLRPQLNLSTHIAKRTDVLYQSSVRHSSQADSRAIPLCRQPDGHDAAALQVHPSTVTGSFSRRSVSVGQSSFRVPILNNDVPETDENSYSARQPEASPLQKRKCSISLPHAENRSTPSVRTNVSLRIPAPISRIATVNIGSDRKALAMISSNVTNKSSKTQNLSPKRSETENFLSTGGTGICRLSSVDKPCSLNRCIFVLSPCVAALPRIVKELLPWHGCLYTLAHTSLSDPSFPVFCPQTRLRYRKILLVDTQSRVKTVEFLKEVKDLHLQVKVTQGKRKHDREEVFVKEWLEIYDWRLLEAVAKIDQGKVYDYDVWKRNFIGTV